MCGERLDELRDVLKNKVGSNTEPSQSHPPASLCVCLFVFLKAIGNRMVRFSREALALSGL